MIEFDLNSVVDIIVPIYSLFVICIIFKHRKYSTRKPSQVFKNPNSSKKKGESSDLEGLDKMNKKESESGDLGWLDKMNGLFSIYQYDGADGWFTFHDFPYLKRIALVVIFGKLNHKFQISNKKLNFWRDYGNGLNAWDIGDLILHESDAEAKQASGIKKNLDALGLYEFRTWINREEKTLSFLCEPIEKVNYTYLFVRRWDGDSLYTVRGVGGVLCHVHVSILYHSFLSLLLLC